MKRRLLLLILLVPILSYAQITTLGAPIEEKPQVVIPEYDSLWNFVMCKTCQNENYYVDKKSYLHLIGQRVFVIKNDKYIDDYMRLFWPHDIKSYHEVPAIEGHYMTIVAPEPYRERLDRENLGYFYKNSLDIAFKDDLDDKVYSYQRPFGDVNLNNFLVVVGHFEKIQQLFEGKELVFIADDSYADEHSWTDAGNGIYSIQTRKRVDNIKKGTSFLCTGVSIDDQYNKGFVEEQRERILNDRVVILLRNEELGDFYCYAITQDMTNNTDEKIQKRCNDFILGKFLTPDDYSLKQKDDAIATNKNAYAKQKNVEEEQAKDNEKQHTLALIKKYGESDVKLAKQGKVKIGWPQELCREAWGEPKSINKTTSANGVHEQWVFIGHKYLYFDNGVLTSIKE